MLFEMPLPLLLWGACAAAEAIVYDPEDVESLLSCDPARAYACHTPDNTVVCLFDDRPCPAALCNVRASVIRNGTCMYAGTGCLLDDDCGPARACANDVCLGAAYPRGCVATHRRGRDLHYDDGCLPATLSGVSTLLDCSSRRDAYARIQAARAALRRSAVAEERARERALARVGEQVLTASGRAMARAWATLRDHMT
jgi:hypothetical protein